MRFFGRQGSLIRASFSNESAGAKVDLNQVAEQYFTRIHRAALVLTGNPWDADDLAQETFLVVARKPDQFQNRSSLYTWLYGILLNLERRQRRRFGLHRRKLTVLWQRQPTRELAAPPAESPLEAAEWNRSLWAIVAELSAGPGSPFQRTSAIPRDCGGDGLPGGNSEVENLSRSGCSARPACG